MKLLTVLTTAALLTGCATRPTKTPLCRHIVLSQYAAFKDAGYETEIVQLENLIPASHKYHAAVRIKTTNGKWLWVNQPPTTFTTTPNQPTGTAIKRKLQPSEVLRWTETIKLKNNN
jgi:hypothetical protein